MEWNVNFVKNCDFDRKKRRVEFIIFNLKVQKYKLNEEFSSGFSIE